MIKIRRGLDLPITGAPRQSIEDGPTIRSVALVGFDYHGMKPTMEVAVGERIKIGQVLFTDKKNVGVKYTSPAAGTVSAINRGYQRTLQSVVVDVEGSNAETFEQYNADKFATLSRETVEENLINSGLWTAFRTRPYSKTPVRGSEPHSIFVAAMDTQPLAADPQIIIAQKAEAFAQGLVLLSRLTQGKVFVCHAPDANLPHPAAERIVYETFAGVHPAGNQGTHIHFLDPVGAHKTVWTIGYQDVIAMAELFINGVLSTDRVVALAGPQVDAPRLIRTRLGANLEELTAGQLKIGENRIVSGSLFGGRNVNGPTAFLGRYHNQVSVIKEGRERPFLHYLVPGVNRFSVMPIYLSTFLSGKKYDFTSSTNGSERAMVPIGSYEKVMPLDILPTQLLRALIVGDTETAQKLGCLELEEEDLALCSYVCSGKYEYGPILRDNLARIEKEG